MARFTNLLWIIILTAILPQDLTEKADQQRHFLRDLRNLPVLYTLDGHGEKDLDASIREDIEKANIEIRSLNLLTEESVPEDTACLMINSPATDISEVKKKCKFLNILEGNEGGKQ